MYSSSPFFAIFLPLLSAFILAVVSSDVSALGFVVSTFAVAMESAICFFAAFTLSSKASAASISKIKCALPKLQCTFLPSASQAGNSPPSVVSLRAGHCADPASASETFTTLPVLGIVNSYISLLICAIARPPVGLILISPAGDGRLTSCGPAASLITSTSPSGLPCFIMLMPAVVMPVTWAMLFSSVPSHFMDISVPLFLSR